MKVTSKEAFRLGNKLFHENKFIQAASVYLDLVESDPHNSDANFNLGITFKKLDLPNLSCLYIYRSCSGHVIKKEYLRALLRNCFENSRNDLLEHVLALVKRHGFAVDLSSFQLGKVKSCKDPCELTINGKELQICSTPTTKIQKLLQDLLKQGEHEKCFLIARVSLLNQISPHVMLNYMGNIYFQQAQIERAVSCLESALKINPSYSAGWNTLGNIRLHQQNFDLAKLAYDKAHELEPRNLTYMMGLANYFVETEQPDLAEEYYATICKKTEDPVSLVNWAVLKKQLGEFGEAKDLLERSLAVDGANCDAHYYLSSLVTYKSEDSYNIQKMHSLKNTEMRQSELAKLFFGLYKAYDDIGDYDTALNYLMDGNGIRRSVLNYDSRLVGHDFQTFRQLENLVEGTDLENISENGIKPIFIIGLPRSGTTLVEQLLAAHKLITPLGELTYVQRFAKNIVRENKLTSESIYDFRTNYLSSVAKHNVSTKHFTDKMPHNFVFLPLLMKAFPEGKFILCVRDLKAVCWSNYEKHYYTDAFGYCYDLEDMVNYAVNFDGLTRDYFPNYDLHTVKYEELVNSTETMIENALTYIGIQKSELLPSEEYARHQVKTASNQQVRSEIYTGSNDRWRRYEDRLRPYFDRIDHT